MSKYPLILIHGFMGWGEDKETLYKYYLDMVKSFEELK